MVRGNRILLAISAHGAVSSLFQSAHLAIVIVFLFRDVGLPAWAIGLLGTASLTGALTAGLTARLLRRRRFFASYGVIVLNVFGMSFQQAVAAPALLDGALATAFGTRATLQIAAAEAA